MPASFTWPSHRSPSAVISVIAGGKAIDEAASDIIEMKHIVNNVIISRTDSIGDVVLALPLAKVLKDYFPAITIAFLGRAYTRPVIEACKYVDEFIDLHDFLNKEIKIGRQEPQAILHVFPVSRIASRAKQLRIPLRIGTTNRVYHWLTCNELVRLSRRNSDLHEAQLNLKLLEPLGITRYFSCEEIGISFGLEKISEPDPAFRKLIHPHKYNLILHPKSQGSAREWGLDNFISLIRLLDPERYAVFISGLAKEREWLQPLFKAFGNRITDITGMMDLAQFMAFINQCDGLVANSTGPLHIAAALGKDALGIFSPLHPIHPGRWGPLGQRAQQFVLNRDCSDCRNNNGACHCIREVSPISIKEALDRAAEKKYIGQHRAWSMVNDEQAGRK